MTSRSARRIRASPKQLSHLVDFMYDNPEFSRLSMSRSSAGKAERNRVWRKLAIKLNSLCGAIKTTKQWRLVWRLLKARIFMKMRSKKNQEPITNLEKRVFAIINRDYAESSDWEEEDFEYEKVPYDMSSTSNRFLKIAGKQTDILKSLADSNAGSIEVAKSQAEALRMLAEYTAANIEMMKSMSKSMKSMNEGIKANADGLNSLANIINCMHAFSENMSMEPEEVYTALNGVDISQTNIFNDDQQLQDSSIESSLIIKSEKDS